MRPLPSVIIGIATAITSLAISSIAWGITPPAYYYWSHVRATLGRDPCVVVRDLTQNSAHEHVLRMEVCTSEKAEALNKILRRDEQSLARSVTLEVTGPDQIPLPSSPTCTPETPEDMELVYSQALVGNPLIASIYIASNSSITAAWVEYKPMVVQVWVDNLGDRYGLNTYTAADAFALIVDFNACGTHPSIRVTTSRLE